MNKKLVVIDKVSPNSILAGLNWHPYPPTRGQEVKGNIIKPYYQTSKLEHTQASYQKASKGSKKASKLLIK